MLLKAKLANVVDFPQEQAGGRRNDLAHVRILVPCVAGYLADAHVHAVNGSLTERGVTNLLEDTLGLITGENARFVKTRHGIDLLECFPSALNASPLGKVRSFMMQRLVRLSPGEGA